MKCFERNWSSASLPVKMAHSWTRHLNNLHTPHGVFITMLDFQAIILKYVDWNKAKIKAVMIQSVWLFSQHHELLAAVCVSHGSTISKGLFFLSSKSSHITPTGQSDTVVSWRTQIPKDAFPDIFCFCHLCWKHVPKVKALSFCHAFHLSCTCHEMIKAWQHSLKLLILTASVKSLVKTRAF